MAPQLSITAAAEPSITTAPQPLKRLTTYDLNSELSWLYSYFGTTYSYNTETDYSSLMGYYSSLLASYTLPTIYPTYIPTATAGSRTTNGAATNGAATTRTATAAAVTETAASGGSNGGLSTGAKIGIGVGVPLAVFLLAGIGIFLWCMGKRKGKQTSTTVVAPAQPAAFAQQPPAQQSPAQQFQQPQMGYTNNQGYMQGYPQPTMSPPPQYPYPHPQQAEMYGGYAKGPGPNVVEMEHEYHFARPGVVEMGDSRPAPQQEGNR